MRPCLSLNEESGLGGAGLDPSTGRWEQDPSSPRLGDEFQASLDNAVLYSTKQNSFPKGCILRMAVFTERDTEVQRGEAGPGLNCMGRSLHAPPRPKPSPDLADTQEVSQRVAKSAQWAMALTMT